MKTSTCVTIFRLLMITVSVLGVVRCAEAQIKAATSRSLENPFRARFNRKMPDCGTLPVDSGANANVRLVIRVFVDLTLPNARSVWNQDPSTIDPGPGGDSTTVGTGSVVNYATGNEIYDIDLKNISGLHSGDYVAVRLILKDQVGYEFHAEPDYTDSGKLVEGVGLGSVGPINTYLSCGAQMESPKVAKYYIPYSANWQKHEEVPLNFWVVSHGFPNTPIAIDPKERNSG